MRYCYVMMLVLIVALAINAAQTSPATIANARVPTRWVAAGLNGARGRVLTSDSTAETTGEERAGISASAVEKAKTLFTPVKAPTKTLQRWLNNGISVDDIFTHLSLAKAGDKLLDDTQFMTWLQYVELFNFKNPAQTKSTIPTLTAHYGDKGLFQMLEAAKRVSSTESLATKLQAEQIRTWLSNKKSPGDVFKVLGLDEAGHSVLSSPFFRDWLSYLAVFNKENPRETMSLVSLLAKYYGHDGVTKIIDEAIKNPSTAKIAKLLQAKQLDYWLQLDTSPGTAFILLLLKGGSPTGRNTDSTFYTLKLNKVPDNLLTSYSFRTWVKYLEDFNKKYPDKKTNVVETLLYYYSEQALSRMLATAKKTPATEKLATNLQLTLLNTWARDMKSPNDVSKLLNVELSNPLMQTYIRKFNWALGDAGDKLFDNPQTWLKYVSYFRAKNPGKEISTLSILTTRYGDAAVAKIIAAAGRSSETETIAKALETAQLQGWLSKKMSPDDIFKLLKLDRAPENLFASSLFATWRAYFQLYRGKKYLVTSRILEALTRSYGDEALSSIIVAAKGAAETKAFAGRLQAVQLRTWLSARAHPKMVYQWLKIKGTSADNAERLLYKQYVTDYNRVTAKHA